MLHPSAARASSTTLLHHGANLLGGNLIIPMIFEKLRSLRRPSTPLGIWSLRTLIQTFISILEALADAPIEWTWSLFVTAAPITLKQSNIVSSLIYLLLYFGVSSMTLNILAMVPKQSVVFSIVKFCSLIQILLMHHLRFQHCGGLSIKQRHLICQFIIYFIFSLCEDIINHFFICSSPFTLNPWSSYSPSSPIFQQHFFSMTSLS